MERLSIVGRRAGGGTHEAGGEAAARLLRGRGLPVAEGAAESRLAFGFGDRAPRVTARTADGEAAAEVDPLTGLRPWEGVEVWARAGLSGRALAEAGRLTARVWGAFAALDAPGLEVGVASGDGGLALAAPRLSVDETALDRQPELEDLPGREPENPRERHVRAVNRAQPGGDARYSELDGDIGMLVAGGGAGLVLHDLITDLGGRPANHSDISPAPGTAKMEAVLDAIFANPRVRGLLVGWNWLQMAPCDKVIEAPRLSVARNGVNTRTFPVVIRLFGPREAEARALAAELPGGGLPAPRRGARRGGAGHRGLGGGGAGMSILIDRTARVLVQGITGNQGRYDTELALAYGVNIVAGVTPGRGGESVPGVPVFDTVARAVAETGADAAVLHVPVGGVCDAVTEAAEAGVRVMLATTENVPRHDAVRAVAAARRAGAWLVGFNTNGVISPGQCKLGGIGGDDPDALYPPGRIGIVSRSGGMSAELALAVKASGRGVSTAVSMGGDRTTDRSMREYLELFEADPETDAMVIYGEPGTGAEAEVAEALRSGAVRKPLVALIAGRFQERHPPGVSFGHTAAMISGPGDSATEKRAMLAAAGAEAVTGLDAIGPALARRVGPA